MPDPQTTIDVREIAKALLLDHLGLSMEAVAAAFPDGAGVPALGGLTRPP